jgi:autotransporter-associated beta strand protein
MKTYSRLFRPAIAATSLASLLLASQSAAATIDFSSSATNASPNWFLGSSWVGGSAPVNDATTDIARFNQTSYANAPSGTASIAGLIIGDGVTATAALGTSVNLTLGAQGINIAANTGAFTFSTGYNNNLVLAANQVWNTESSNLFVMRGLISGAFSIEKTGTGAINFDGRANTFSGGFTLTQGNARVGDVASFGTSLVTLNGGTLSTSGASSRVIANAVNVTANSQLGIAGISGLLTLSGPVTVTGNQTLSYVNTGSAITGNVSLNGNLTFDSSVAGIVAGNTVSGIISDGSGSFGITKTGTGQINLTGVNTFTGNIAINQGTLRINNVFIADTATVSLLSGAVFDLNFSGTDTIGGLFLAGLAQADGTYGSLTSAATFKSSFFTGNGILNVSAIPEPSTYAFIGGALMLGIAVTRRRRGN